MLTILFNIAEQLLRLYSWAVILAAVFSMLVSFGVLDTRNRLVWTIGDFLYRVTEPALRPLRRFVPTIGNIDITPVMLKVVDAAVAKAYGAKRKISWVEVFAGDKAAKLYGTGFPDARYASTTSLRMSSWRGESMPWSLGGVPGGPPKTLKRGSRRAFWEAHPALPTS